MENYINNFLPGPIQNPILINALKSLSIPFDVWVESGLLQCDYLTDKRPFFAFCWATDRGGYTIASTGKYRSFYGKPGITTISRKGKDLFLFDDFLTFLQTKSEYLIEGHIIILNFQKHFGPVIKKKLKKTKGDVFFRFLDNRFSGVKSEIWEDFPNATEL